MGFRSILTLFLALSFVMVFLTPSFAQTTKPDTVTIEDETYSGVSNVTLSVVENVRKVRIVHRTGIGNFDSVKVPPHFLTAWGFPPDVLEKEFAQMEAEIAAKAAQAAALAAEDEAYRREEEKIRAETLALLDAMQQAALQADRDKLAAQQAEEQAKVQATATAKTAGVRTANDLGGLLSPDRLLDDGIKLLNALGDPI